MKINWEFEKEIIKDMDWLRIIAYSLILLEAATILFLILLRVAGRV